MDKKDQLILSELVKNSRMPLNQLAKKCGISREVANYRMKKLIDEKIITDFYTIINTKDLGFSKFGFFLQLRNVSSKKEKEIVNFLEKNAFISYLGIALGKWNIVCDLYAKDRLHLEEITKELMKECEDYLESYMIAESSYQISYPTKMIDVKPVHVLKNKTEKLDLDEIDLKILSLLSKNSRAEYKELSSKLNMVANTIKYRIKNLERTGIIQGYSISIDVLKLGYECHNIQIKITKLSKEKELMNFLSNANKVIWIYKYIGNENWDLDIGVIAKNSHELREFIISLKENYGESTKIHDFFTNLEVFKGDYAPEGIFNSSTQ